MYVLHYDTTHTHTKHLPYLKIVLLTKSQQTITKKGQQTNSPTEEDSPLLCFHDFPKEVDYKDAKFTVTLSVTTAVSTIFFL